MKESIINNPKTFGDWAYLAVKKHFKKTIKHESDVLKDKDPEALHQMRVGMRRLRTAVTGFAPALALPKAAQEDKIGKIARKLGELRDIDVLKDALENQYLSALPTWVVLQDQDALKKILSTLADQRQTSLEEVQTTLKDEPYHKLKRAFKDYLEQPKYGELAEISIYDILPDLLLPSISKLFLEPAWLVGVKRKDGEIYIQDYLDSEAVAQLLDSEGDKLHSLRKQAKRVRYQMELFTDFYNDNYQDYFNDVKEMQSILGEIQDSFVLGQFLTKTLGSDITVQLPSLAAKLTETRYQAWQKWQSLQQRYLYTKTRKDFHKVLLKPVATANQPLE
jgi:CHAD domain-containing protein